MATCGGAPFSLKPGRGRLRPWSRTVRPIFFARGRRLGCAWQVPHGRQTMTRQALKIALAAALLAAPIAAHTQAPLPAPARPAVPHPPPRPQQLKNGAEMIFTNEFVVSGGYMISQNQQFIGIMQNDGRFCIYRGNSIAKPGPIVRCAPADPKPYAVYTMQMRP